MKNPKISVIVCTRNRCEISLTCVASLAHQNVPVGVHEILVIDNNSEDDTAKEIKKLKVKNLRYIKEANVGLSYARNRGLKESHGEYVAYIDDDAKANSNWVSEMLLFIKNHPHVRVFGGPYGRFSKTGIPVWFPPDFGIDSLGNKVKEVNLGREWLNGTNMVFERDFLIEMGGFNTGLGMKGATVAYGEETELLIRIKEAGVKAYYDPKLKVMHLLDERKLHLKWLLLNKYRFGRTIVASHGRQDTAFYHTASFAHKFLIMIFNLLNPSPMPLKRRIYYAFAGLFSAFGALHTFVKKM